MNRKAVITNTMECFYFPEIKGSSY